jgi:AraC-like DNA-binding protein
LKTLLPDSVEASDGYVDLKLLLASQRVARLEEQLAMAEGVVQRVRLIESFLLDIRHHEINARMAAASRLLCTQGLRQPVHQATRALQISERHLSRQFKSTVGLQPSVFMRIMRFQRAIRARRKHHQSWAAIAADCGYSDQAHLIRDVRTFSGQAPGQIILDSGPGDSSFNGEGVSEFFDTVYI